VGDAVAVVDPRIRKIKEKYENYYTIKNTKKIQIVSDVVMSATAPHESKNVCEAITKSGKRCSFKPMCNGKCKKHSK